jgi:hypothetical protein
LQREYEIRMDAISIGMKPQRGTESVDRAGDIPTQEPQRAKITMGFRELRIERDCLCEKGFRQLELAGLVSGKPEDSKATRVLWVGQ